MFHGTIPYNFDLSLVEKYLKEPPVQPEYRFKRPHNQFIKNIQISKQQLVDSFKAMVPEEINISPDFITDELLKKYH